MYIYSYLNLLKRPQVTTLGLQFPAYFQGKLDVKIFLLNLPSVQLLLLILVASSASVLGK